MLKNLVIELNLKDDVIITGYQKNPFKYVKRSYLYIFTSFHEGLPRAVVESLIVGTPVVGFTNEYADLTEIFEDNNDVIVEYPNIDKLSQKILYYLRNKDKYKKIKDETFIIAKKFSLEKAVEEYLKLIKR